MGIEPNKFVQDVATRAIGAAVAAGAAYVNQRTGVVIDVPAQIGVTFAIYGLAHKGAQWLVGRIFGGGVAASF